LKSIRSPRIIFITGTDTGVGKTVLTSLLIAHLKQTGACAAALKPFCSGSRSDAEILFKLQEAQLTLDEINPWFFPEPLAPLVAARKHRQKITLDQVLSHIRRIARRLSNTHHSITPPLHHSTTPTLLVEGAGGLLVPLGQGFTVLDLITKLRSEVLLVSANRLGTINHTLLSVQALHAAGLDCRVVLMETGESDPSSTTNARTLGELLSVVALLRLPFLRPGSMNAASLALEANRFSRRLRAILELAT